ncbi:cytochrome P450, partial [Rhizopogon vinicolor AM-OR11-026]
GWIDEYGPLITIRRGTEKIVIIGRHKAAVDIMERQGGSVADRHRMVAAGEMLSGGLNIAFAPIGAQCAGCPKAAEEYEPLQMSEAKNMVLNILDDPSKFLNHTHYLRVCYASTTIMKVAYGKNAPATATDPEVIQVHQVMAIFVTAETSGTYLVESIPWLKYLPWYDRELKRGYESSKRIHTSQLNRVKQQMSNVNVGPSFAKHVLENRHHYDLIELEIAFLAGAYFGGGSVLMAAACFPKEQANVQAELDEVIGRHREYLPHLQALISEALRWRPLAPDGKLLHPSGHYGIRQPLRWMDDQGYLRDDIKSFVFGFGRRLCPAQDVANSLLWIPRNR